jgi:hypothetical protein
LEVDIKNINASLQSAFSEMKLQSQQQASQQKRYDATLLEILELLKQANAAPTDSSDPPTAQDNPPKQSSVSGGSNGAAGLG